MAAAKGESGAPQLGLAASLVVIHGDNLGKLYSLNTPSSVIGRSSKCEIPIDQESISRNHSKIVNSGKFILIRDLGSTNGTYVNDQPIEEYVLRDGDLIKVGRTIFKFLTGGNIEHHYHEQMQRLAELNRQPVDAAGAGGAGSAASERSKSVTVPHGGSGRGGGGGKTRA